MMGGGWRWRGGSGWWRLFLMPLVGGLWWRPGGRGWRWMYRLTGMPGWMRFGFSPGWFGKWPTPQQAWPNAMGGYYQAATLQMLKEQAKALQEELEAVLRRIKELEGGS